MVSIRSWINTWLSRASVEDPNTPITWANLQASGTSAISGVTVTRETALTLAAVFRGVSKISDDVGRLEMVLHRKTPTGPVRATEHPAYRLVNSRPTKYVSAMVFRQTMHAARLLTGNGYAFIDRDESGAPSQLTVLDPQSVRPVRADGEPWYVITTTDGIWRIQASEILHIRGLGADTLSGYSLVQYATNAFGITLAAEDHCGRFYGNGSMPGICLETEHKLNKPDRDDMKLDWENMHRGVDKRFRVAIMPKGTSVKTVGISPQDAQLLQAREHQIRDVATWFGLPPHLLGDTTRTARASLEVEARTYLDALDVHLRAWEEEYEKLLTDEQRASDEYVFRFDRRQLVLVDAVARGTFLRLALGGAAFMTVDEARAGEGMPPLPDGAGAHLPTPNAPLAPADDALALPGAAADKDAAGRAALIAPAPRREPVAEWRRAMGAVLADATLRAVRRYVWDGCRAIDAGTSIVDWSEGKAFVRNGLRAAEMLAPSIAAMLVLARREDADVEPVVEHATTLVRTGALAALPRIAAMPNNETRNQAIALLVAEVVTAISTAIEGGYDGQG